MTAVVLAEIVGAAVSGAWVGYFVREFATAAKHAVPRRCTWCGESIVTLAQPVCSRCLKDAAQDTAAPDDWPRA